MCLYSIGVACGDVERLCIIDVAVKWKPEIAPQSRGLPHIMSDAREAKIVTSHYDSCTAQRTSVTGFRVFFLRLFSSNAHGLLPV